MRGNNQLKTAFVSVFMSVINASINNRINYLTYLTIFGICYRVNRKRPPCLLIDYTHYIHVIPGDTKVNYIWNIEVHNHYNHQGIT